MQSNLSYQPMRHRKAQLTRHAAVRSAQRGIGFDAIELIRTFGERTHDGRGGVRCLMTRNAVLRVERLLGHSSRLDALEGNYIVVSADDESVVITVSHRI